MCIDQSGSMRSRDVDAPSGGKVTRWSAVFDSAEVFLADQARQTDADNVRISLVMFSDEATTCFDRLHVEAARTELKESMVNCAPSGGTCFAAGLQAVRGLASADTGDVLVIFLSDGRPGDLPTRLHGPLAKDNHATMPTQYRSHGETHASAAMHLHGLRNDHEGSLSLHFVGIHAEGFAWLQTLAQIYEGTFHETSMELDDVADGGSDSEGGGTSSDVRRVDIALSGGAAPGGPGPATQASAALAAALMMPPPPRTSIRSTFRSISSSFTSMRAGTTRGAQRSVALEKADEASAEATFKATKMDWASVDGHRILHIADAEAEGRRLSMRSQPFAQGGFRNVFHAFERNVEGVALRRLVVKESRYEVPYEERLAFHKATTECQVRAKGLADKFNAATAHLGPVVSTPAGSSNVHPIQFISCEVFRLSGEAAAEEGASSSGDASSSGEYRYISVEPYLPGAYVKYNTNNGYVRSGKAEVASALESMVEETPQAFSHFSYVVSGEEEMVVDLQGVEAEEEALGWSEGGRLFRFTDPQLHSRTLKYGSGDHGRRGFDSFFRTHRCGQLCRALGLRPASVCS